MRITDARVLGRWILVLLLPLAGACQNTLVHRDWSEYDGPGREHFLAEEVDFEAIDDPIEPSNRAISAFNHGLIVNVVAPVGWVYRRVFPEVVRDGIENVFDNIYYPVRLFANLFQGKLDGAWDETQRFAVNTTVGILGIRDQASEWDIAASRETFGQTFGTWGWEDSSYLVVPVLGPSTIRDGVGGLPDALADPLTYHSPWQYVRSGTRISNLVPTYKTFVETNYDPYTLGRRLFILNQELKIDDYVYQEPAELTGETETLGAIFLGPEDDDFPDERRTHSVSLPDARGQLDYSLWLQPEPRPLVYFLPGTGGHRLGGSATGVAEIAYEDSDNSIITISSAFNFEFIEGASSAHYPGFAPVDAHDIHVALTAIDEDVQRRYPGRFTDERRLVGVSLGGMHTLFIAAQEADPHKDLMSFDGYLALNSPVSMRHAVSRLDEFLNAPLVFPEEDRQHEMQGILRKVAFLAEGEIDPSKPLSISKLEAEFLIGLSFRLTLGDIIYQTTLAHPRGVLLTERSDWKRTSAYQEIARYSFMEYFYAWVLPYFAEQREDISFSEAGADHLFDLCDLRSIEDELAASDKILFVSNRNDFLLRPEDIEWAERVFGDDCLFFERGGHIGNLHRDDIQQTVRERFVQKVGVEP